MSCPTPWRRKPPTWTWNCSSTGPVPAATSSIAPTILLPKPKTTITTILQVPSVRHVVCSYALLECRTRIHFLIMRTGRRVIICGPKVWWFYHIHTYIHTYLFFSMLPYFLSDVFDFEHPAARGDVGSPRPILIVSTRTTVFLDRFKISTENNTFLG